jgi:TolB-like protein
VKPGIAIPEFDDAPDRDHQQTRFKHLFVLRDAVVRQFCVQTYRSWGARVISRTSVMPYKRVRKPLPQIAQELGVDAVVEGTVLRSGDRVRITAQLIEASADNHLWAQSYEGELRDTLTLQNQVARAIAEEIRISLNPQEESALKNTKVVNPEAYVSYLKGRYFWNKRTGEGLTKAIDLRESERQRSSHGFAGTSL